MLKTAIGMFILIAILLGGYWWTRNGTDIDPALKSIVKNYVGADGVLYDPTDSLGVKNKDNIGYKKDGRTLEITYGKQAFKIDLTRNTDVSLTYLKALGLTIDYDAAGNMRLKYRGEAVKEFE